MAIVAQFSPSDRARSYYPACIAAETDVGFAFTLGDRGQLGLSRFNFATGEALESIFQHERVDLDRVRCKDGAPWSASFTPDVQQTILFDQQVRTAYADVKRAIGGNDTQLLLRSYSADRRKLILWGGNAADPGVYYLLDRDRGTMDELAELRPGLDYQTLVAPRVVSFTARDGVQISGYLTLPRAREQHGLPLILLPHGGPYGVRDSLRYDDEVQFLANRGYAVLQPNYRGSDGYGSDFHDLGNGQIGRAMQDDLDDAMDWAVGQGIADPSRVCVVGGSYGGYAALWAAIRNPERYRCAASWAGVTDWDEILRYDRRFLDRYDRRRWRRKIEGGDGFRLATVSPARRGGSLSRPVLLAHGTRDGIVPFEQFEAMEKATKNAPVPPTKLVVHGADHSFSRERDQQQWLDALDLFLAQHNPADQVDDAGRLRQAVDPDYDSRFVPLVVEEPSERASGRLRPID